MIVILGRVTTSATSLETSLQVGDDRLSDRQDAFVLQSFVAAAVNDTKQTLSLQRRQLVQRRTVGMNGKQDRAAGL